MLSNQLITSYVKGDLEGVAKTAMSEQSVIKGCRRAPPPSPSHRPFIRELKADGMAEARGACPSVEPERRFGLRPSGPCRTEKPVLVCHMT